MLDQENGAATRDSHQSKTVLLQMKLMGNSKLTSKFRVTVPKLLRELLELDIGDLQLYLKDHDQVILKRCRIEIEG